MKTALVLGLGASGFAAVSYLAKRGWKIAAADSRREPPYLARIKEEFPQVTFAAESNDAALLDGVSLLVLSPGISPDHSFFAPLVARARSLGIDIAGEIELFARELKRLRAFRGYAPKIIGITGTNGKTTTTMLSGHIVREAGHSVCVAGNVGPNALLELDKLLAANTLPEYWVLELSSFQLATTRSLECTAATVLNVTEDHIDWHGSFENYALDKARIYKPGTVRIFNRGDARSVRLGADTARVSWSFGSDAPSAAHEFGTMGEGKGRVLAVNTGDRKEVLIAASELLIRGEHNVQNALAASALCFNAGIGLKSIASTLRSYKGEPHRVQKVLEGRGLEFIDDSKGTNVGATAAALKGFGSQKVVIILGGDGKGQDFSPLKEPVFAHARGVVLIGRDAPRIEAAIAGFPAVRHASDMAQAVAECVAMAEEGDAVLLSPACASWDMFRDYAQRSEFFIEEARKWLNRKD
jgi:UDP-N-acetylmuramoylalanine--D-glutamate ligase